MTEPVTFMAVGDTSPHLEPPERQFATVEDTLSEADLTFAQVERTFSDRGTYNEISMGEHSRYDPEYVAAYEAAGFDVAGIASNHAMDWGEEALVDTIRRFEDAGIEALGVGADVEEARQPAVFERAGRRVAVLGYCSVLLPQYWATGDRAGCAPLRAHTYYEPYEYQPGTPPRVVSEAREDDLEALRADIGAAREEADVVIVSNHWGLHFRPGRVADYQRDIARVAAEAGCDLLFGHHQHLLNGVEFFDGMPCAYSLGNFAMTYDPDGSPSYLAPDGEHTIAEVYDAEFGPDTAFGHKDHYRKSAILRAEFDAGGVDVSFLPAYLARHPDGPPETEPVALDPDDPRFDEVARFIEWSCGRLGTEVVREGGRLRVRPG